MFRFRSRYQQTFVCSTLIMFCYFSLVLVLRDIETRSDIVPLKKLISYIIRHEGPPQNDVNGNSNDCVEKYGPEMFEIWKATEFEICTNESSSKITCYLRYDEAVTRRMCLLSNTKIRLYEPYYVASTSNLSSEATIKMQNDILAADCAPFVTNYNGTNERKMQFDSFFHVDKFEASRNGDLQCNHTVLHSVFWMWRWDATNAYHFLEDVTNTFASLALLNEDPDQVEIAIYDGMQGIVNNPLFTFWSELFPKGVRIIRNNPFPRDTCFRRSITNMYGMRSHFTEFGGYKTDTFCSSPILKGFRDWATDKMHIKRTNHVERVTLLFVSRQQYLSTRKITRVLVNEDIILETIRSTFPLLNVIRFRPENYTTFKEQVQIAVKANIMVGVHGAGLVYSLFMSPGSHLIEVFMDDRNSANKHFHNIATWMDLRHHSVESMGKLFPPEVVVKVIGKAMKELDRKTTAG